MNNDIDTSVLDKLFIDSKGMLKVNEKTVITEITDIDGVDLFESKNTGLERIRE